MNPASDRCLMSRPSPLVSSPCENINRSHTRTHRQRTTSPTPTHTRTPQEQHPKPPNEHLPQTLNKARRWRLPRVNVNTAADSLDARLFIFVMSAVAPTVWPLHDIAITNFVCRMAKQEGRGGNHILHQIDCKMQRGGVQ